MLNSLSLRNKSPEVSVSGFLEFNHNWFDFRKGQFSTPNVPGHETASIVICTLILSPCTIFSQESVFYVYSNIRSIVNKRVQMTGRL